LQKFDENGFRLHRRQQQQLRGTCLGEEDETATQGLLPIINQWNNQLNEQLKNMNNEQSIDRALVHHTCQGPFVEPSK
jgi:hypothetical protein